jgi:hypothetical protein
MRYLEVPYHCISAQLEICPLCNDTKTVTTPLQTVKLSIDPEYRTECSKCDIWWKTYKKKLRFNIG